MVIDACKFCGAAVFWASHILTMKGAPLDATPNDHGNCVYYPYEGTYRVIRNGETIVPEDRPLYTNHFATCPDRAAWRK